MSNEELVMAIQAGDQSQMEQLWLQMENLVRWKARRILSALDGWGHAEYEDLIQSGYLALDTAVCTYKPDKGAFSNWFLFYLKSEFAEVIGYQTDKMRNDPLRNSVSLDRPLGEENDGRFIDVLADPLAEQEQESVEDMLWRKQLHDVLEQTLGQIPKQYGKILKKRYCTGLSREEVAKEEGISGERVRQRENTGIRLLRRPEYACHLYPFYEFDVYCGTGLTAFKRHGASVQEQYLLVMEEREKRKARMIQEEKDQMWSALKMKMRGERK